MGPRHYPELPIDPAEAVPNGAGDKLKLSTNLPIGVPSDKKLQDLDFALREPNLGTGACRRRLVRRARLRPSKPFASQHQLDQGFEPGFSLQQLAMEGFK
jgi:hypothetical protein